MYRRSSNFVIRKSRLILQKCEVTNDVRYQECTEITLDFERQNKVKGYFFLMMSAGQAAFLYLDHSAGM